MELFKIIVILYFISAIIWEVFCIWKRSQEEFGYKKGVYFMIDFILIIGCMGLIIVASIIWILLKGRYY